MSHEATLRTAQALAGWLRNGLLPRGTVEVASGVRLNLEFAVKIALADLDDLAQTVAAGRPVAEKRWEDLGRHLKRLHAVVDQSLDAEAAICSRSAIPRKPGRGARLAGARAR